MKYVWLILSVFNLVATIVFLIRKDFGALPFSLFGTIMCLGSYYVEDK